MTDAPKLIRTDGADNLVDWNGRVWRVPQALGPTDLDDDAQRARPGITEHGSLEDALAARPAAPAAPPPPPGKRVFDCSWWESTGEYTPFDENSISSPIYRRIGTGEVCPSNNLPPGALYCAPRDPPDNEYPARGSDGLSIVCVLPGGHRWYIEGSAGNCTMPDDKEHRCWVRHGTVGEALTVDKNGATCAAGGGSIDVPGFHGMLQDGQLREC